MNALSPLFGLNTIYAHVHSAKSDKETLETAIANDNIRIKTTNTILINIFEFIPSHI